MAEPTADSEGSEAAPRASPAADGNGSASDDLFELRRLLMGPEHERVLDLQDRFDDPVRLASDVGRVLPESLILRGQDPAVSRALAPAVEEALQASVRANPQTLADALFPVMGPAIRKYLTEALAGMLEGLNRALEHSFSPASLGWRWEAMRTGKPFAEIVLLHTVLYRVEQVFLIHRQTGLLLQHVTAEDIAEQVDADMVSGMLTAIRDFVQDSFGKPGSGDSVEELRVGERVVWVEQSPHAILAAVIRGAPPKDLRISLQTTLEGIHARFGSELEEFQGDTAPLAPIREYLEPCLLSQYREKNQGISPTLAGVLVLIALLLGWWGFSSLREGRRWADYLHRLEAEPGVVVISQGTRWGTHSVIGLRDPLSRDPLEILSETDLNPDKVVSRWEPYQALLPRFIVLRARALLQPPPEVTLSFSNGVLYARGPVDAAWLAEAGRLAKLLPGVILFQRGEALESSLDRLRPEIENCKLRFPSNEIQLQPGQEEIWQRLVTHLREVAAAAAAAGRPVRVEVRGHADSSGTSEGNLKLSLDRATLVRELLLADGVAGLELEAQGLGSQRAAADRSSAAERLVTFRIVLPSTKEPAPQSKAKEPR